MSTDNCPVRALRARSHGGGGRGVRSTNAVSDALHSELNIALLVTKIGRSHAFSDDHECKMIHGNL